MSHHLVEHHASVTVNAPSHQVYALFTHFNDFPKFMSFVKEVTYYDDQRSHWVADIVGRHVWDAVNENWEKYRQIGWRSYDGQEKTGRVTFQALGPKLTMVHGFIAYLHLMKLISNLNRVLHVRKNLTLCEGRTKPLSTL